MVFLLQWCLMFFMILRLDDGWDVVSLKDAGPKMKKDREVKW